MVTGESCRYELMDVMRVDLQEYPQGKRKARHKVSLGKRASNILPVTLLG